LRHQAVKMGLRIGSDGRVSLQELLNHQSFRAYTLVDIMKVVEDNNKQRFLVAEVDGVLSIRAAQGHTMEHIEDSELLVEITDPSEYPVCVHGTYRACLDSILNNGLNRMKRNHIHMAVGIPEDDSVISGMRASCQVVIYVNMERAMAAGIRFFKSSNGVILTKGLDDSGVLPPAFFDNVEDRSNKRGRK
jgi:2'-phosphotransferase